MGLSRLYVRYHEWRLTHGKDAPPAEHNGIPMPPLYLITLVTGSPDWRWFLKTGEELAPLLDQYASAAGVPFAQAKRILDFGCGCGRVLRHLPGRTQAELHGVDYNPGLVRWCARHLPGRFKRNQLQPPLSFPDDHFDVTYLLSVFTHMRRQTQELWLEELCRVTRPGGVVLISFHDETHPYLADRPDIRALLEENQFYVFRDQFEGSNRMATFETAAEMRRLASAAFEVVQIIPSNESGALQAIAVLRKRSGS